MQNEVIDFSSRAFGDSVLSRFAIQVSMAYVICSFIFELEF